MKSKLLFSLIILGCTYSSYCQNQKAIGINLNAHRSSYPSFYEPFNTQYAFPSLEFQKRNKNGILIFELAKLSLKYKNTIPTNLPHPQFPNYTYRDGNFSAIIRGHGQRLLNIKHKHWQPYIGGAISFHYIRNHRKPYLSTALPKTIVAVGFDQHLSLGTYYNLGKYYVQANALLGFSTIAVQKGYVQNQVLPYEEQQASVFNFNLIPKDNLFRIGVGMRL